MPAYQRWANTQRFGHGARHDPGDLQRTRRETSDIIEDLRVRYDLRHREGFERYIRQVKEAIRADFEEQVRELKDEIPRGFNPRIYDFFDALLAFFRGLVGECIDDLWVDFEDGLRHDTSRLHGLLDKSRGMADDARSDFEAFTRSARNRQQSATGARGRGHGRDLGVRNERSPPPPYTERAQPQVNIGGHASQRSTDAHHGSYSTSASSRASAGRRENHDVRRFGQSGRTR